MLNIMITVCLTLISFSCIVFIIMLWLDIASKTSEQKLRSICINDFIKLELNMTLVGKSLLKLHQSQTGERELSDDDYIQILNDALEKQYKCVETIKAIQIKMENHNVKHHSS